MAAARPSVFSSCVPSASRLEGRVALSILHSVRLNLPYPVPLLCGLLHGLPSTCEYSMHCLLYMIN